MITAVILASGFSRRMGRSKLTLRLGDRTLLERAIDAATHSSSIARCLVVLRPEDAELIEAIRRRESASETPELLLNTKAADGQSAGVRLAAERLIARADCEAAIFSVVDQPFLGQPVFEALVAAWRQGMGEIVVSTYAGQRGNPVLFARRFFPELLELSGDVGGRDVIRRHPEAVCEVPMPPDAGADIDTREDYLRAQARVQTPSE
ncbi:MAG: NTP transferase domain-containing protein [Chloroflexi bacterium]|nr:NTP transferase domain-containing protein [Chloroflexota bacterium]